MRTRVAIVGGGTAGFMAAVHLSRTFPSMDVVMILDPRIPTIGVGEGTTPGFSAWLTDVSGASFEELQASVRVTVKRGVQFEQWGRENPIYTHAFVPADRTGLHLSASQIVVFLRRFVPGEIIEGHVLGIDGEPNRAVITIENRPDVVADVAIDARGFPRVLSDEHIRLSWIPTDAALVTRAPRVTRLEWTRAVARPHGWIFVIGLTDDTAYGYIYGRQSASLEEVRDDFEKFLTSEGVVEHSEPRRIEFPNFVCKAPYQQRVLKIGNAASFIEPLEATSIALTRYELDFLTAWLRAFEATGGSTIVNHLVDELNRQIVELILEVALFIGWHYAEGSVFDTTFWREAKSRFWSALDTDIPPEMRRRFLDHIEIASSLPTLDVTLLKSIEDLDRRLPQHRTFPTDFGGMTPLGFAQVGRGIAFRNVVRPATPVS